MTATRLRWRKVKSPNFSRYIQPAMERFLWNRDHGGSIELARDGKVYATVKRTGAWSARVGAEDVSGSCGTVDEAKASALAWVRAKLAEQP